MATKEKREGQVVMVILERSLLHPHSFRVMLKKANNEYVPLLDGASRGQAATNATMASKEHGVEVLDLT